MTRPTSPIGGHPDESRVPREFIEKKQEKSGMFLKKESSDGDVSYTRIEDMSALAFANAYTGNDTEIVDPDDISDAELVASGL